MAEEDSKPEETHYTSVHISASSQPSETSLVPVCLRWGELKAGSFP